MDAAAIARALGTWDQRSGPLYEQLAHALTRLVEQGDLPPGARLPSERRLAHLLDVSRGTVVAALDVLREAGLVRSRQGSGTVVTGAPPPGREPEDLNVTTLLGLNVIGASNAGADFIDLQPACWSDAWHLPRDVFDPSGPDFDAVVSAHGYTPAGLPRLRSTIADYLSERGLATLPEQILVTAGAHQAIDLVTRMVVTPGDAVATEELTYPGARDIFRAAGARVAVAPLTPRGVDVGALERLVAEQRPRLVYLIPTIQNPTAATMPADERERLAAAAARWDAVLIDDESLAETVVDGHTPPPIAAFAAGGEAVSRIFTVGSASKSFWGGLRTGWIRGPEPAITALTRLKTLTDLASPVLSQVVTARLLERRHELAPRRIAALRERLTTLTTALERRLPEWEWETPSGGLAVWTRLPEGDAARFCELAMRRGVGVVPGTVASPQGRFGDHVRLSVGPPPDRLEEAVDRLADAWQAYRGGAPSRAYEVIV